MPLNTLDRMDISDVGCLSHFDDPLHVIQVPRRFVAREWGGTETTILQTSRALEKRGYKSEIYTTTALCEQRSESIHGIDVLRHPYSYPFLGLSSEARNEMDRKGGNLLSFSLLQSLLTVPGVDMLHAHSGKRLGGIVRTAARRRGIPYVISLHGGVFDVPGEEMEQMLQPLRGTFEWGRAFGALLGARRVLEDADAIICVGQNEQHEVQSRMPNKRVDWLPNGVDTKEFASGNGSRFRNNYGIANDSKLILCVSRIDYQKNQLALIEMLPELLRRHEDAHLMLIGPVTIESYRKKIDDRITACGLREKVTILPGFLPGSEELVDAFHAADVFCLPSLHEPFGIVVLEAWASGLPVVASRVGGIPTFTKDGENILHINPDDLESIVQALDAILADKQLAGKLADNGMKNAVAHYDWSQISQRLSSIYHDIRMN